MRFDPSIVAAFAFVYCSLSVLQLVFVLDISKQSPFSGYRFVCNKYIVLGCNRRAIVSEVPLMYDIIAVVTGPELV